MYAGCELDDPDRIRRAIHSPTDLGLEERQGIR